MMFTKDELETILYSLEGYIQGNDDDKLCDELEDICNKIVEELDPPKVTITPEDNAPIIINLPEGTNLTRVIRSDSDYADQVDTLVSKMASNDDNIYTHDSEGC